MTSLTIQAFLAAGLALTGCLSSAPAPKPVPIDDPVPMLLALNKGEDTVSLINMNDGTTIKKLKTGPNPNEVATSPNEEWALISDMGAGQQRPGYTFTVVDLKKKEVARTVDLRPNGAPHGVVWLNDSRVIYTSHMTDSVCIFDFKTDKVIKAIPTEQKGTHLVLPSPDQMRAYAVNAFSNTVTVIDLVEEKVIKQITCGNRAEGISLSPDGGLLACGNVGGDTVSIIDTAKLEVVKTLEDTPGPIRTFFVNEGANLVVSCANTGELAVFKTYDCSLATTIKLGEQKVKIEAQNNHIVPMNFCALPDGRHFLVVLVTSDAVAKVDAKTWEVTQLFKTGPVPDGIDVAYPKEN